MKRPRPPKSPVTAESYTLDLDKDEFVPDSQSSSVLLQKTCKLGHSYFPKSTLFNCPFCSEILREFRLYASSRGGILTSSAPDDFLVFRCHRTSHPEFSLQTKTVRSNPGVWCPLCKPDPRHNILRPDASNSPTPPRREMEGSRMAARLEEGKRDQAKLLNSAKMLYQLTSKKSSSSRSSGKPSAMLIEYVRFKAREDRRKDPELTEGQCLVVRAILAGADKPSIEGWGLIAEALEAPISLGNEKLYRRAAKEVHPDKCHHPEAGEAFKILSALLRKN